MGTMSAFMFFFHSIDPVIYHSSVSGRPPRRCAPRGDEKDKILRRAHDDEEFVIASPCEINCEGFVIASPRWMNFMIFRTTRRGRGNLPLCFSFIPLIQLSTILQFQADRHVAALLAVTKEARFFVALRMTKFASLRA